MKKCRFFIAFLLLLVPIAVGQKINLDTAPYAPDGWSIAENHGSGQLEWNSSRIQLYLSASQKSGRYIRGYKVRKELAGKKVLNANALDFLLAHQDLIPKSWKGKNVYFWGTIYVDKTGDRLVRSLYWHESSGSWNWNASGLSQVWNENHPAVIVE